MKNGEAIEEGEGGGEGEEGEECFDCEKAAP